MGIKISGSDLSYTAARLVLGASALVRGISNTFGIWGGPRLHATASGMADQAAVSADAAFYILSIGMILLGTLLIFGIGVRIAALLTLGVAIWHAYANNSFHAWFAQDGGCEHLLPLAALSAVLARHGAGALQIRYRRKRDD